MGSKQQPVRTRQPPRAHRAHGAAPPALPGMVPARSHGSGGSGGTAASTSASSTAHAASMSHGCSARALQVCLSTLRRLTWSKLVERLHVLHRLRGASAWRLPVQRLDEHRAARQHPVGATHAGTRRNSEPLWLGDKPLTSCGLVASHPFFSSCRWALLSLSFSLSYRSFV